MGNDKCYYTLTSELAGDLYFHLLDFVGSVCKFASLVIRPTIQISRAGERGIEKLSSFLVDKTETSEWPGTTLINSKAVVLRYELEPACISVLKELSMSLYGWQQPNLPEDLCFLREDGSPLLVSISHEKDGYLYLSDLEYIQLIGQIPDLKFVLEKDA